PRLRPVRVTTQRQQPTPILSLTLRAPTPGPAPTTAPPAMSGMPTAWSVPPVGAVPAPSPAAPPVALAAARPEERDDRADPHEGRDRRAVHHPHRGVPRLPDPGGAVPGHHPAAARCHRPAHRHPALGLRPPREHRVHRRHGGAWLRARRTAGLRARRRL